MGVIHRILPLHHACLSYRKMLLSPSAVPDQKKLLENKMLQRAAVPDRQERNPGQFLQVPFTTRSSKLRGGYPITPHQCRGLSTKPPLQRRNEAGEVHLGGAVNDP